MACHGGGNGMCRQRDERRLDVGGRNCVAGELRVQPFAMNRIAARAFRRHARKERLREKRRQQRGVHASGSRPRAVTIERGAPVPRVPEVEQHVARSGVEAAHIARRRQIGEIGDASEIDDDTVRLTSEERGVERGHQRRAFASSRDIAAPEIGDDRHPGPFGNAGGVVQLQRPAFVGTVAQRLTVDTRGNNVRRSKFGTAERRADCIGIGVGQRIGRARRAREFVAARALQGQQLVGKVPCERDVRRASNAQGRPVPGAKSAMTASTPSRLVPDITPA